MMLENKAIAVFEDLLRAGLWGTPLNGLWKELKEEEWKQVLWLARQQTGKRPILTSCPKV